MARPFEHPVLTVETFPVTTSEGVQEYVRLRMPDWCNILPITADGEVVLVRQHRWGIGEPTLEIPGGAVDPGEAPEPAARRELREETGFAGGVWTPMGWVSSNPAIQDNRTWLYLAEGVTRVGEPDRGPGEEDLEVTTLPVAELPGLLERGAIHHALAVVTLQRYLLRRSRGTVAS